MQRHDRRGRIELTDERPQRAQITDAIAKVLARIGAATVGLRVGNGLIERGLGGVDGGGIARNGRSLLIDRLRR